MKFLISGSSGLIGSALVRALKERGNGIVRLVRHEEQIGEDTILWDPQHREINLSEFEGFDVAINLAGESISSGRWTEEKKKKIQDSRVLPTHMLSELFVRLKSPPKILLSASAVGYYGNRGSEELNEDSAKGEGFLSDVCQRWEAATEAAQTCGIRVVLLRFGVVLAREGGALGKMFVPFKCGLGGVIGSGSQYFSWISIDDLVGVVLHAISHEEISGPVNAVSPCPVTNRTLTKVLGKVLGRPTLFPLPVWLARFAFGEMADEMLLSSTRAVPKVLEDAGYSFLYPDLEGALKHLVWDK